MDCTIYDPLNLLYTLVLVAVATYLVLALTENSTRQSCHYHKQGYYLYHRWLLRSAC